jgi:hypothetical protein
MVKIVTKVTVISLDIVTRQCNPWWSMYIRKSTRTYKGKTYTNHLLVESVQTAKGPR